MTSYSLNSHLLWSGRPPGGEQDGSAQSVQPCTRPGATLARGACRHARGDAPNRGYTARTAVHSTEGGASDERHDPRPAGVEGGGQALRDAHRVRLPHREILDEAGIPVLLVGDSVAHNVLGYENDAARHDGGDAPPHPRGGARRVENALVVGDMPFMSYQASLEDGRAQRRAVPQGGRRARGEDRGSAARPDRTGSSSSGIPVMAHVGPHAAVRPRDGRVPGPGRGGRGGREGRWRRPRPSRRPARSSIVLEGMPADLGAEITSSVQIPTIGIGAGPDTDAQVLVLHDLLGLSDRLPRFAKAYANLRTEIGDAARAFADDVASGAFPDEEHSYSGLSPAKRDGPTP